MIELMIAFFVLMACLAIGTLLLLVAFCICVALSIKEENEENELAKNSWSIVGYNDEKE